MMFLSPNIIDDEYFKFYLELDKEITKSGVGSIYIIRKSCSVMENENWIHMFLYNHNMKKEILQNLNFVIIHTHTLDNIDRFENHEARSAKELLQKLQYFDIEKHFVERELKPPSQFFIQNWDVKSQDYLKAQTQDQEIFLKFLQNNDEKLISKMNNIINLNFETSLIQDDIETSLIKKIFGMNGLRKKFLEYIFKITLYKIEALESALLCGFYKQQTICKENLEGIYTYSNVGKHLKYLYDEFSSNLPLFTLTTHLNPMLLYFLETL